MSNVPERRSRRSRRRRIITFEPLEARELLVSDFHNEATAADVNDDGLVTPIDALEVINDLNSIGARELPPASQAPEAWIDTSNDGFATALDALLVIDTINNDRNPPVIQVQLANAWSGGAIPEASSALLQGRVTDESGTSALYIQIDGGPLTEVTRDRRGSFSLDLGLPRDGSADRLYEVRLVARDARGNESSPLPYQFKLDTTPPEVPTVTLAPDSDSEPAGDGETEFNSITLVAPSSPGDTLSWRDGPISATAGSNGRIELVGVPLEMGTNVLRLRLTDRAGNSTDFQTSITRVASGNRPPVNTLPRPLSVRGGETFVFGTEPGTDVSIADPDIGDSQLHVQLEAASGKLTLSNTQGLEFVPTWELAAAKVFGPTQDKFPEGRGVVLDDQGNLFVTGSVQGATSFKAGDPNFTITPAGNQTTFVLKLDPTGEPLWLRGIQGTGTSRSLDLALDPQGNVLITGDFNNSVDFDPGPGTFNLSSGANEVFYVWKLDANGNFVWARSLGGATSITPFAIATDAAGSIYTTGNFQGTGDFDPGTGAFQLSSSTTAAFISKLNSSGQFVWAQRIAGSRVLGEELTVTPSGDLVVVGQFEGTTDFDASAASALLTANQDEETFVMKVSSTGQFRWVRNLRHVDQGTPPFTFYNSPDDVAVDADGNLFITGFFQGNADFDPSNQDFVLSSPRDGSFYESRAYLWKLTGDGNFEWVRTFGGNSDSYGTFVGVDASGFVYLSGSYNGIVPLNSVLGPQNLGRDQSRGIYAAQFDGEGNLQWAREIASDRYVTLWSGDVNAQGIVAFSGNFSGTFDLDPGLNSLPVTPLSGPTGQAIFVTTWAPRTSDGMADQTIAVRGALARLNTALDGLMYRPDDGFGGPSRLQMTTSDLGHTGPGGPKLDLDELPITVLSRPVVFNDPDVEAAVRVSLGLAPNAAVDLDNIKALKELKLDTNRVQSLGGLEHALNLESLRLEPTDFATPGMLTELHVLTHLMKLQHLSLVGYRPSTTDLAALAQIPNLGTLDLRYCDLTDISALLSSPRLETLLLYGNARVDLSSLRGKLIGVDLPSVKLEQAQTISEVAAALHYLPLEMFEFVRNNIEYEAYAGAAKGAQATLDTRAGNAWDQASLLIALLHEAGVSARFASGRVTMAPSSLQEWVGTRDASAAATILNNAGLNVTSSIFGATFDHAWVEADFVIGGQIEKISLDPSWKLKDRQTGIDDLLQAVPFDQNDYLSQVRTERAIEYYIRQATDFLNENVPSLSLADIPHDGPTIAKEILTVPNDLPYSIEGVATVTTTLPDSAKVRARLTLKSGNVTLFSRTLGLPEVSLTPVNLTYAGLGTASLRPELRLGEQVLVVGSAIAPNSPLTLISETMLPGDDVVDNTKQASLTAGQWVAVGLHVGQFSPAHLDRLRAEVIDASISAINGGAISDQQHALGLLNLAIGKYFGERYETRQILDGLTASISTGDLEFGVTTSTSDVDFYPDLLYPFVPRNAQIDVPGAIYTGNAIKSDDTLRQARFELSGMDGSALENTIWEELIHTPSLSTVKSLQLARSSGTNQVLTIDSTNRRTLVPQLTLSPGDVAAIERALDDGATVITPRDPTPLRDWNGVGYLIKKNDTLSYLISGGLNGELSSVDHGGHASGAPSPLEEFLKFFGIRPDTLHVGDPVDISNGNVTRDEIDLSLPGIGMPLEFQRHYRSQSELDLGLGTGWVHTYSDRLTFPGDGSVLWMTNLGYQFSFEPNGAGGFLTPMNLYGQLDRLPDDSYRYREKDGTTHTFDTQGRLTSIRDRNHQGVDLSYDAEGRLTSVTDGDAPWRSLTFGHIGAHISTLTDFTGRTWTYTYSGNQLVRVDGPEESGSPSYRVAYDYYSDAARQGLLREITQPDGGVLRYSYYPNRRAFQVRDAEGFSHTLEYNFFRKETVFTDERGEATVHAFNEHGNRTETRHPDLTLESFEWLEGLIRSRRDALGLTERWEYDDRGNLLRHVDRAGQATESTYDPTFNQIRSLTRPGGARIEYTYDAVGNLVRMVDPLGNVTTRTFDDRGLMLSETAPLGNLTGVSGDYTTSFTYNDAGQVIQLATDAPSFQYLEYDQRGNLVAVTDANGSTNRYTYDILGRPVQVTDPMLQATIFTYDAIGNTTSTTDALGRTNRYAYDLRQRLTATTFPDQTVVTSAYDGTSNAVRQTDELGRVTRVEFDARNRPFLLTLPDSAVTRTRYDSLGRVEAVRDANGNWTEYAYDKLDRLISTIDARDAASTREYDAAGNLIRTKDRRGAETSYEYDLAGRLVELRGPEGLVLTYDYDANGNLTHETRYDVTGLTAIPEDPRTLPGELHRVQQFRYDVLDRMVETIDPLGQTARHVYDAGGRLVEQVDVAGRSRFFQYDPLNRITVATDALGGQVQSTYDAMGNLVTSRDPLQRATSYEYDARDRLIAQTDSLGGVAHLAYDGAGNLVRATDQLGRSTAYEYDVRNRRTAVVDPLGGRRSFSYDAMGNLTDSYDELGRHSSTWFDAVNRPYWSFFPDGSSIYRVFDAEGNVVRQFDERDNLWEFKVDAHGRTVETTDPLGHKSAVIYDSLGNLASATDELQRTTQFAYDQLGRRTSITDPLGHVTTITYDAVGNTLSRTDANQLTTTYRYDPLDRVIEQSDPLNGLTRSTYDAAGNLLSLTDPGGNATYFEYDALNRIVRETNALGQSRFHQYDAVGNRVTTTDRNGRLRQFDYDRLNRRTREVWLDVHSNPLSEISFAFDAASQLQEAHDSTSRYMIGYDAMGRVKTVDNDGTPGVPHVFFSYKYDSAGNLLERTDTIDGLERGRLLQQFDELNRVTQITQSGARVRDKRVNFTYDAVGQWDTVTRYSDLDANQPVAMSDYSFDAAGRLTGLSHSRNSLPINSYTWSYDPGNRMTEMESVDGISSFTYDLTDQLTGAQHSFQSPESYEYDASGNRASPGYQTGFNNRLLSDGDWNYEYDGEGNRTKATRISTSESIEYSWDHRNRLTRVTFRDAQAAVTRQIDYTYDVFDRRVAKQVDMDGVGPGAAATERFVYDGDHIALVFDGLGQMSHRYLYGPAIDQVLADENSLGEILWPLADHQGTVRDVISSAGNLALHRVFDSFGNITNETAAAPEFRFAYTGRELDEETGLHFYRARYYDAAAGRFLSEDPIGFAGGDTNLVRYVVNSPLIHIDPFGHELGSVSLKSAQSMSRYYESHPATAEEIRQNQLMWKSIMQGIGGVGQVSVGVTVTVATCVESLGAGCALGAYIYVHGIDDVTTALNNLYYGQEQETATKKVVYGATNEQGIAEIIDDLPRYPVAKVPTGIPSGVPSAPRQPLPNPIPPFTGAQSPSGKGVQICQELGGEQPKWNPDPYGPPENYWASRNGGPASYNQMNAAIQRGQAPKGIQRVDPGRVPGELPHVHFQNGAALNQDGTWKHGSIVLSKQQREWLTQNGWALP